MSAATILERAKQGEPLTDLAIIDFHGHVGPWKNFYSPDLSRESLLKVMDRAGIRQTVLFSNFGVDSDPVLGNRMVFEYTQGHTDRLIPFVFPSARFPGQNEAELKHYCLELGWKGIKIHPGGNGHPADGPLFQPVWRFAAEHGRIMITHTWDGLHNNVATIKRLATQYPSVPILCAHCFEPDWAGAIRIAQQHANIYLELTDASCHSGVLEWFVRELGPERIIFGSDVLGWFTPLHGLGGVLYAEISDEAKRLILHGNAAKLLAL